MRTQRTRVEYRPGQWLARTDLEAQAVTSSELLDLHQARVHDTWGIATGFDCTLDAVGLNLGPGIGLDALGRTILLAAPHHLLLPPSGNAVLVAAFAEHLHGDACVPGLPVEAPVVRWRMPDEVRAGLEVPLVALRRTAGAAPTLDRTVRKRAQKVIRPRIATGRVQRASVPVHGTYGSWTMAVSTAAGGLSSPSPVYFVTLDQHPWGDLANFGDTEPPPLELRLAQWVGPFIAVEGTGPTGFAVRVSGDLGDWHQGNYPEPGTNPVGLSWVGIDTTFIVPARWSVFGGTDLISFLNFGGFR